MIKVFPYHSLYVSLYRSSAYKASEIKQALINLSLFSVGPSDPVTLNSDSAAHRLLELRVRNSSGHGFLSRVSVVCCQVGVSASG
jgi:hypothetical protein